MNLKIKITNKVHIALAVVTISIFNSIAYTQSLSTTKTNLEPNSELSTKVNSLFSEWDKQDCPGCAVAVIKDGQTIYKKGYGIANIEHNIPITTSSVFYVGSVAKQFTAMSIALLAQQGKISLDDDVRKYVPELPDYGTPITVRQLVHHTSGLRDFWDLINQSGRRWDDAYNFKDIMQIVTNQKELNFKPGEKHAYSNTGYLLMAMIVKQATGKSLREYAEEQIFKPLGMRNTRFHDDHTVILKNRVNSYAPKSSDEFSVHLVNNDLVGAGGLWTTVDDLLLWDSNFYSAKVGGGELIKQIQIPGTVPDGTKFGYAFGLQIEEYKGLKRVKHGGALAGYRAEITRFPDKRFSVIILCNSSSLAPSQLAEQIADIYLNEQ